MNSFFVEGKPVPQGSLKFIHGRPIHERAADLAIWRANIAREARHAGVVKQMDGSVWLRLVFFMRSPKTVKREEPYVKPDLDKLIRAVLDGLTGVAYDDDCQVTQIEAEKHYCDEYNPDPGVWITVNKNKWTQLGT
jgi:crossover junction endodeoxyribonuclease RusA